MLGYNCILVTKHLAVVKMAKAAAKPKKEITMENTGLYRILLKELPKEKLTKGQLRT